MNKAIWLLVSTISKGTHKLFEEPIKKCLLGKHGTNVYIGHEVKAVSYTHLTLPT